MPLTRFIALSLSLGCVALLAAPTPTALAGDAGPRAAHETTAVTPDASLHLLRDLTPRQGDLADFARHGWTVRVLVPYSRTFYWVDAAGPQGYVPAMLDGLEAALRTAAGDAGRTLRIAYVATPLDEMQEALAEGRGEIAAGAVVSTPAWDRVADMTTPVLTDFDLCVASGPESRPIARIEDLAGRTVVLSRGRAADDVMQALVPQFEKRGLKPPVVDYADDHLALEDVLEMVGAGTYEYTIVPRPLMRAWQRAVPTLKATPVSVSEGQHAGYAVRRGMPDLLRALNAYLASIDAPARARNLIDHGVPLHSPPHLKASGASGDARLQQVAPLIVEAATKYGLDPVKVAAQCFQESRFDPRARSHVGAMGLMQLMPATARELGVTDPLDPRQNLDGGCRYMVWLRRTYFTDPQVSADDQYNFCLAAYNAGAGNVRKWRALAKQRGLDPNRWFGQVERVARANGVLETVTYVSQIAKYEVQFRGQFGTRVSGR